MKLIRKKKAKSVVEAIGTLAEKTFHSFSFEILRVVKFGLGLSKWSIKWSITIVIIRMASSRDFCFIQDITLFWTTYLNSHIGWAKRQDTYFVVSLSIPVLFLMKQSYFIYQWKQLRGRKVGAQSFLLKLKPKFRMTQGFEEMIHGSSTNRFLTWIQPPSY